MGDDLMQLIAANIAGDLIQLADSVLSIEDVARKYAAYAEVDLASYKVGTTEWRCASIEQADFDGLLNDAEQLRKQLHKIANGVAVRQLGGEL